MTLVYVGLVFFGLIILGDDYPKQALAIAALIFLAAVLYNTGTFKKLLEG